jgi:NDP-hexose-3-ketoreductase
MNVLLVGLSRFAQRRVLPALAGIDEVTRIHVASRHAGDEPVPKLGERFADYERALAEAPRGVAYISQTHEAHATWVERALELGHHVVVDKPAFLDLATAERLVALARSRSLLLAEATTWTWHTQLDLVHTLFANHGVEPKLATVAFTPPLPPDNFRFRAAAGGGALFDTGPYFASIGRALWNAVPRSVHARVTARNDEVDTAYSVLADYGDGRALVGHFGFTTEYRNWIHLATTGFALEAHGMFSTGPDIETEITVRHHDAIDVHRAPPSFAMQRFLAAATRACATNERDAFADTLLADARVRDALTTATQ